MGISGSLKDVSVADVMQFIHLGRRTGTLLLARGAQRAMIGFHLGRLVSAQAPRTPKLGDLLVSSGMIDRGMLERAIELAGQRSRSAARSARSWSAPGSIDPEGLRQVIAQQIEQAVCEVMVWDTGTFEFAIDDLRPIDDIALYPSDVLPDADINTQMVLLEAARIFDERNRDIAEGRAEAHTEATGDTRPASGAYSAGYSAGDATHPTMLEPARPSCDSLIDEEDSTDVREGPKPAAELLKVHLVSSDHGFAARLGEALAQRSGGGGGRPPWRRPAPRIRASRTPIILVDLRGGGVNLEQAVRGTAQPPQGIADRPGRARRLVRRRLRGRRAGRAAARRRGGGGLRRERDRQPARPGARRPRRGVAARASPGCAGCSATCARA